jgi:hypothetical protein
MSHLKNIGLILLLGISFIRCTEIYTPDISSDTQALIVEGLITDEAGPFTVKLSMAKPLPFDSVSSTTYTVRYATLTITDNESKTYTLKESTPGNYVTPSTFKSKIGNIYKLHIKTKDGNSYESNPEKLLPPQTYDSIRGIYSTEDYINSNNDVQNVNGVNVCVDLFKSLSTTDVVQSCRFKSNIIIQYMYMIREVDSNTGIEIADWHWIHFGWNTYSLNSIENISDERSGTTNSLIKNHSIGFVPYGAASYGLVMPLPAIIYYLRVSQYTMNNDSYLFYKGANNQLSASGKIFDPITSQLYGNMKCVNDPTKIVLGLFEVSSVKQHGFVVGGSVSNNKVSVTKVVAIDVLKASDFQYKMWDGDPDKQPNDSAYTPIPFPSWWYHN